MDEEKEETMDETLKGKYDVVANFEGNILVVRKRDIRSAVEWLKNEIKPNPSWASTETAKGMWDTVEEMNNKAIDKAFRL